MNPVWLAGYAAGFITCIIVMAVALVVASRIKWHDKEDHDD